MADSTPAATNDPQGGALVRYPSFGTSHGNPWRLAGSGQARITPEGLQLSGRAYRFLRTSRDTTQRVAAARIHDVVVNGATLSFDIDPAPGQRSKQSASVSLLFDDASSAQAFARGLPARISADGEARSEFATRLAHAGSPAIVPGLIAANLLMYVCFAIAGGGWLDADPKLLIRWGSNFGPYTSDGQWWRLLSAAFLHGGLIHLLVNMATLYDVGRLCERLYGRRRFLVLYGASALIGSAASLWWNPMVNSVGASGALFGVLAATFVYMLDRRNAVPVSIIGSHGASIAVFILYGLANGLAQAGIDNAAHVGGLLAGAVAGLALARPLRASSFAALRARLVAGVAVCAVLFFTLLALTPNSREPYELEKRFLDDIAWLEGEETALIAQTRQLFASLKERGPTEGGARPGLRRIVVHWESAYGRLSAYHVTPGSRLHELQKRTVTYVDLRRRAMLAVSDALDHPQQRETKLREFTRLMKEGDGVILSLKQTGGDKGRI